MWGGVCTTYKMTRKRAIVVNLSVDETGKRLTRSSSLGPGITPPSTMAGKGLVRQQSVAAPPAPPVAALSSGNPGVYITTKDAETLTGGPTIFLAEDVEKIAKFYLKQSYIPASILSNVMEKIDHNNKLSVRIAELEAQVEQLTELKNSAPIETGSSKKTTKKKTKEKDIDEIPTSKMGAINEELNSLYRLIKPAELNEVFVPNKSSHLSRWAQNPESTEPFTSSIDEETVCQIMAIEGISDTWKILLLMGIGVFANHNSESYTEIMKQMASEQKLYLIIASSDYIYGTNYQFCHGYIGRDISFTQEKMIQAMGRVGRNASQHSYSVRLRDDSHGQLLFKPSTDKVEVVNMNKLFVS